jgi:preprotein translocase subunit Sss1
MDWNQIASWFKTSILGIVILGAVGSIIALPLIHLIKWGFNKLVDVLDEHVMFPMSKRMRLSQSIIRGHLQSGDSVRLIVFVVMLLTENIINTLFMCTAVGVTVLYFVLVPARLTVGSFILVTVTFICVLSWLISLTNAAGIQHAVFGSTIEKEFDRFRKMRWEEYVQVVREVAPESPLAQEYAKVEKQEKSE